MMVWVWWLAFIAMCFYHGWFVRQAQLRTQELRDQLFNARNELHDAIDQLADAQLELAKYKSNETSPYKPL